MVSDMKSDLIRLVRMPVGMPQLADFGFETEELKTIQEGQLLLKPLYISVDPYLRAAMNGGHPPALNVGDIIVSRGIAEVITSRHEKVKKGDVVMGYMEWRDLLIANAEGLDRIDPKDLPLSTFLSVLGSTGLSAYFAMNDIGKPKSGETLVVSGAAGAVGSIAGQIGKLFDCRVIGIAGSNAKAELIVNELGYDAAINYKTDNIQQSLKQLCPDGIDIYFDNVGGDISDAVIPQMNNYGRVVVCGTIAEYNEAEVSFGPRILPHVVFKKLLIQGFLIGDYKDRFAEGLKQLQQWISEDKILYRETIIKGFDQLPAAFIGLFNGKNEGKMLVEL